jgi:hypothetical protein
MAAASRVPSSPQGPASPRALSSKPPHGDGGAGAVDWATLGYMLLNFASSTCLVVINKIVMDKYHFRFATTLTCFHLVSTFVMLLCAARAGMFEIKRLPLADVWKLAAGTMGFICLTNLSLQHNSVGFYQVMKVRTRRRARPPPSPLLPRALR